MTLRLQPMVLLCLAFLACGGPWRQTESDNLGLEGGAFDRVRFMLSGGRVIEAGQSLSELPVNLRETPQWAYLMGRTQLLSGHADRAVGYLEDAHRRMPASAAVKNDLAVALVRAGKARHALPLLDGLLAAHPKDPDLRLNQAVALQSAGRTADAQETLSRLARERPDWFDARFNLGLAALANGDAQTAVFEFRQAARLKAGDRDVLLGLAAACTRFQDHVCSEQAIREAISRFPEDPKVLMGWGNQQEASGKLEEARHAFGKSTQVAPNCADCWYGLGRIQERLGDKKATVRSYERHLEIAPEGMTANPVRMRLKVIQEGK
ncbi:MAG: tetratricopeptide repeat protein [Deltaproteobacteria bacterium]|nr:tetratricopeptide repeat protein [Deltaproteobacteria bacterium]